MTAPRLTPEDVAAVIARVWELDAKATTGPWKYTTPRVNPRIKSGDSFVMESGQYGVRCDEDAAFIAESRTLLPQLAAEVTRLQEENAALRNANESVAVCAEHVRDVTYTPELPCLVCRVADLEAKIEQMQLMARQHASALDRAQTPLPLHPTMHYESGRRAEREAMVMRLTATDATLDELDKVNESPSRPDTEPE